MPSNVAENHNNINNYVDDVLAGLWSVFIGYAFFMQWLHPEADILKFSLAIASAVAAVFFMESIRDNVRNKKPEEGSFARLVSTFLLLAVVELSVSAVHQLFFPSEALNEVVKYLARSSAMDEHAWNLLSLASLWALAGMVFAWRLATKTLSATDQELRSFSFGLKMAPS